MGQIIFKRNNKVTCHDVSMGRVILGYICWILAGKPHNHKEIIKWN